MDRIIIGSEALAAGRLSRYELRRNHRRIFPDVYAPKSAEVSLRDRTVGAWLWSRRGAVISGVAASALHGAHWVDPDEPIELIRECPRPPAGVVVRNETLHPDEVTRVAGLPVTTLTRTAFDLGRHLPRERALVRLDALMRATPFSAEEVIQIAEGHPGARGLRQLRHVLPLVDGGAASPRETWLRLLLMDAGFPRPTTQIPLSDRSGMSAVLDMGWEEFKVAAEYDGDQHRTDRRRYVWDQRRSRFVDGLGWHVVRVIKEDRRDDIIARVDAAMRARGWRPEIARTHNSTRTLSA